MERRNELRDETRTAWSQCGRRSRSSAWAAFALCKGSLIRCIRAPPPFGHVLLKSSRYPCIAPALRCAHPAAASDRRPAASNAATAGAIRCSVRTVSAHSPSSLFACPSLYSLSFVPDGVIRAETDPLEARTHTSRAVRRERMVAAAAKGIHSAAIRLRSCTLLLLPSLLTCGMGRFWRCFFARIFFTLNVLLDG